MNLKKVAAKEKISKSHIGLNIQELMDLHKTGLSKVAAATGLTSETIRQIVNGTVKNPGIETLSKIAEAFSVSLFQLLDTKDVTALINKKKIKIIDMFDLQKLHPGKKINDLLDQSIESTEILYIDNDVFHSDFFAIEVNANLADKLTNSGMPMIKQHDLLIFTTHAECVMHAIVLARYSENNLTLGIIMEIEDDQLWIKSIDIPQKQIVVKIKKDQIIGIIHNVQFSQ